MIKRLSIISTAVLAAMLIAGLAWATPDDSSSSTSSTTSTTLAAGTATGAQTAATETYDAGAAGRVTVVQSGASLSIGSVSSDTDWANEVEIASGREVEVKFVNGNERIDFQAELEDGMVKTRVRTRTLDGSNDTSGTVTSDDAGDDSSDDSVADGSDDSDDSDGSDDSDDSDDSDGSDDSDDSEHDSSGRSHDDESDDSGNDSVDG
jgi:hypothetical protein